MHIGSISLHEGNATAHLLLVVEVALAEEGDQGALLLPDAIVEEAPAGHGVANQADWIDQQNLKTNKLVQQIRQIRFSITHLSSHRPEEPAEVGRMSTEAIDAIGDQQVFFLKVLHDDMTEIFARGDHARLAYEFAQQTNHRAQRNKPPELIFRREEVTFGQKFDNGQHQCHVIVDRMIQQKRIDGERV